MSDNAPVPTPAPTGKHKAKYEDKTVEIYYQDEGNPLTDGWYLDTGTEKIKSDSETILSVVDVEDVNALVSDVIASNKQRVIGAIEAAQTLDDFYNLGTTLARAQEEIRAVAVVQARKHREAEERLGGMV